MWANLYWLCAGIFELWEPIPISFQIIWIPGGFCPLECNIRLGIPGEQILHCSFAGVFVLPAFYPSGSHAGTSFWGSRTPASWWCRCAEKWIITHSVRWDSCAFFILLILIIEEQENLPKLHWTLALLWTWFVLTAHLNSWPLLESAVFLCFIRFRACDRRCRMHFLGFCPFLMYSFYLLHATVTKNGNYVITLCVTTYKGRGCF